CTGSVREVALELRLHARPLDVAQPGLAAYGPLARPQLQHLARPAQSLAHGAAPVDELTRHERGTSRKPGGSATSRTSQPAAAISSRRRSAPAKSLASRASRRCAASSATSAGTSS